MSFFFIEAAIDSFLSIASKFSSLFHHWVLATNLKLLNSFLSFTLDFNCSARSDLFLLELEEYDLCFLFDLKRQEQVDFIFLLLFPFFYVLVA